MGATPPSARGSVVFRLAGDKRVRIHVEIVRTPPNRARGLMYRKQLGAREGMLFVFDREEVHSFWMKNTYIPLDMIFISGAKKVVGVLENARPMTTEPLSVGVASRFVVEVNAGFANQHGIQVGTPVQTHDEQGPTNTRMPNPRP
jgi:uncharacterized membrane protein (UPF0127 family)